MSCRCRVVVVDVENNGVQLFLSSWKTVLVVPYLIQSRIRCFPGVGFSISPHLYLLVQCISTSRRPQDKSGEDSMSFGQNPRKEKNKVGLPSRIKLLIPTSYKLQPILRLPFQLLHQPDGQLSLPGLRANTPPAWVPGRRSATVSPGRGRRVAWIMSRSRARTSTGKVGRKEARGGTRLRFVYSRCTGANWLS